MPYTDHMITKETAMTDATPVQMPQRWDLACDYDGYIGLLVEVPVEEGDYVKVEDVNPLVDEINRLRAHVQVLEREVERLKQKSEKDWKWFSDATGGYM
jgi:hypothetical protein